MTPWESLEFDQHEQVCAFGDCDTGLKTIICVHSTALGPAVGGTRFYPYTSYNAALDDALRLSRAMSYKCALAGVPFGGGKAVIIGDPGALKTPQLLHAYGRCLNRIGSSFSTGEDVGTSVADCEVIREVSPYVGGTNSAGAGDPSIHTAQGVFHGLRAVVKARMNRDDLAGIHVAIQGLGSVGWRLCELLHGAGARLTVADVRGERASAAQQTFAADIVHTNAIHAVSADVFSPCALGGAIHPTTLEGLAAKAIAGAANNQLAAAWIGEELHRRGILFAPDYVINAGGVLGALEELARTPGRVQHTYAPLEKRLLHIYHRLLDIFNTAAARDLPPQTVALQMAKELLGRRQEPACSN